MAQPGVDAWSLRPRRPGGLATAGHPPVVRLSGTRHLNSYDVLQHAFKAAEDRQLVDLLRHLLQRLQLLQPQQRRVVVHQARGVEQGASRSRFLAPADQVRLCDLFRLHHLVEDHLHFTRQDDVLHTHRTDHYPVALELPGHNGADLAIERPLVAQQLIQGPSTHRFAQCELQFLVDVLDEVDEPRPGLNRVQHLPERRQIDAQAHLVARQDFLTRDLHRLQPKIHQLHLDVALELQEGRQAWLQHITQFAVRDQQTHRRVRHLDRADRSGVHRRTPCANQDPSRVGIEREVARDILHVNSNGDGFAPVQLTLTRRQHRHQAIVLVDQSDLAVSQLDNHQVPLDHGARLGDQYIDPRVLELRHRDVVQLDLGPGEGGEKQVHAGLHDRLEAAVTKQKSALVLRNRDSL